MRVENAIQDAADIVRLLFGAPPQTAIGPVLPFAAVPLDPAAIPAPLPDGNVCRRPPPAPEGAGSPFDIFKETIEEEYQMTGPLPQTIAVCLWGRLSVAEQRSYWDAYLRQRPRRAPTGRTFPAKGL